MTNNILGLIPVIQSTQLMGSNLELLKKRKKRTGDFIKQGVQNIVGAELISETSNFID